METGEWTNAFLPLQFRKELEHVYREVESVTEAVYRVGTQEAFDVGLESMLETCWTVEQWKAKFSDTLSPYALAYFVNDTQTYIADMMHYADEWVRPRDFTTRAKFRDGKQVGWDEPGKKVYSSEVISLSELVNGKSEPFTPPPRDDRKGWVSKWLLRGAVAGAIMACAVYGALDGRSKPMDYVAPFFASMGFAGMIAASKPYEPRRTV
jgi:hypothetical protein